MTNTSVMIQRQDPAIEAYRLGLLGDVQSFTQNQILGQNVQNLRAQGLTPEQIAQQLSRPAQGTEGQPDFRPAVTVTPEQVSGISDTAMFAPPDYQVAQLSNAERAAVTAAQQGIGGYAPFLGAGSQMIGQGQGLIAGQAAPMLQQGLQRGLDISQQGIGQMMASIGAAQDAARTGGTARRGLAGQVPGEVGRAQQGAQLAAERARAAGELGRTDMIGGVTFGRTGAEVAAERARQSTADAQRALMEASSLGRGTAEQGIAALAGTGQRFDPSQISPFTGAFEDAAVQQALSDIGRQGQLAQQGVRAQAVGAGAFGGSRQAVAEQELQRNVLEQQGRTAAQMRAAGFESAAQRAQQAFEQQQARQQQLASLTGQLGQSGAGAALQAASQAGQLGLSAEQLAQTGALQSGQQQIGAGQAAAQLGLSAEQLAQTGALQGGQLGLSGIQTGGQLQNQAAQLGMQAAAQQAAAGQGIGSLGVNIGQLGVGAAGQMGQFGTQLGQLGVQQAGIGELTSRLGAQDIQNLMATGGMERGVQQATLDAQRLSDLQRFSQPYQQFGFLSDIYAGVPTGQMTTTAASAPQVSPFQTALGLGIQGLSAAAGAQRAGLF